MSWEHSSTTDYELHDASFTTTASVVSRLASGLQTMHIAPWCFESTQDSVHHIQKLWFVSLSSIPRDQARAPLALISTWSRAQTIPWFLPIPDTFAERKPNTGNNNSKQAIYTAKFIAKLLHSIILYDIAVNAFVLNWNVNIFYRVQFMLTVHNPSIQWNVANECNNNGGTCFIHWKRYFPECRCKRSERYFFFLSLYLPRSRLDWYIGL